MNVYEELKKINPVYLTEYEKLIKSHAQFGGGAADQQFVHAKSFSNVYEFYIYAFFIGLYKNVTVEIISEDKTNTFWAMENWKPKDLVDYLFTCLIGESDFDMVRIEQMNESEISEQVKILKRELEKYANGGLRYIDDLLKDDPDLLSDDTFFIRLISEVESK